MASRTMFKFEDLKTEASKLSLIIGGQKGKAIPIEVKSLEAAIKTSNITAFDKAYKNIEKALNSIPKMKAKNFNTKLLELKETVDKGRGRGNPLSLINVDGAIEMVVQGLGEDMKDHDGKSLLKEGGNRRPPSGRKDRPEGSGTKKPQTGAQGRSEKSGDSVRRLLTDSSVSKGDQSTIHGEQIKEIKDKLYNACRKYTDNKPSTPKKTSDVTGHVAEIGTYADILIDHLEMKSGLKGIKETQLQEMLTKKDQEAKQMMEKVNTCLERLRHQVDEKCFDERDFKSKESKVDEKKTRKIIEDICVKLKNMSKKENADTEKQQLTSDIDTLEKEIYRETPGKDKKSRKQDSSKRIQNCVKELKKEKENILNVTRSIYKAFWDLNKEKKYVLDRKHSYIITETDTVILLCEVSVLQNELLMFNAKEEEDLLKELQELRTDVERDWNDQTEMEKPTKGQESPGSARMILRSIRLQFLAKTKTLLTDVKSKKNEKEQNSMMEKELKSLKESVKKIWHTHKPVENKQSDAFPADTTTALTELEKIMTENTEKVNKLEKLSFSFERVSNEIHEDVIGVPPFEKDTGEWKTTIDVLNHTFKILERCSTETKLFAANFSKLYETMPIKSTDTNETMSRRCTLMTEAAKRWRKDNHDMKAVLENCQTLVPEAYTALLAEPYLFTEPRVNSNSFKERSPAWLQEVASSIRQIHGCIVSNKESFMQRFTHTRLVYRCLFQTYTSITNEEYRDEWKESKVGQKSDKEKSSLHNLHVGFVIEDVCKRISKSSADSVEQKCQKYIDQLKKAQTEVEQEKQSLLTRLSKLAGANLTNNNPNIADLSDPHRPTKLADEYSELYDNEWTVAFEELEKQGNPEKEIVKLLLGIITGAYDICGDIGRKQDSVIRNGLLSPADCIMTNVDDGSKTAKKSARSSGKSKAEQMKPKGESLAPVHSKTISELRKQTAKSSVSCIIVFFKNQPQFSEWFTTKAVEDYTVRCIEVCWLMAVQDPPVYMDKDLKPGSSFETTKYKSYTKAGKKLAFVVWPALFLNDGGAILAKGVAQGK